MRKGYLGDAVYAEYDGYMLTLMTRGDNEKATNAIHLDQKVFRQLLAFMERIKTEVKQAEEVELDKI
jgi:hypothetical protein